LEQRCSRSPTGCPAVSRRPARAGGSRADRLPHPLGSPVHVPSAGRVGAHARNPKTLTELLELRGIPGGSAEGRERQARRGSASRDPPQRPPILRRGAQTQPVASSSGRATGGGPAWCSVRGGKLDFEGCRWFDHQVVAAVTVRGVSAIDVVFAESRLGGARVALAEGAVRHRLVAVFAGGCAPGGRLVHFPGAGVALCSAQRWLLNLAAVFQRALVEWRLNDGCRGQSTVRG
jgi:hypothetical protein